MFIRIACSVSFDQPASFTVSRCMGQASGRAVGWAISRSDCRQAQASTIHDEMPLFTLKGSSISSGSIRDDWPAGDFRRAGESFADDRYRIDPCRAKVGFRSCGSAILAVARWCGRCFISSMVAKGRQAGNRALRALELDEALMALFIGAMDANGHVAREELARAHHLIWSTRRFRRKSGETVGRLIDRMKRFLEQHDPRQ
jgi:hypothetical protein